jgi:hypothetical protein
VVLGSVLLLAALTKISAAPSGANGASKLIRDLSKDYQKIVYPDNITLELGISFVCGYMDEEHGRLNSRVIERYHWVDSRLRWDPKAYEGVTKVSIPDSHIWTPDVRLQNAIITEDRDEVNAVVLADGNVYWIPPAHYKSRCADIEEEKDAYHCKLSLGSWTYDANSIPLDLFFGGFDSNKMYLESCPYVLEHASYSIKNTKYDCCPNPYATLNIEFDMHKRKKDKKDDDDDSDDDSDSDSDSDDDDDGYKPTYSKDCVWPHCS